MPPEPVFLKHQDPPWLWGGLSVGSIALHMGLLLLLGGRGLTLQTPAPTRSGNWVPITLWSAASDVDAAANPAAKAIATASTPPAPVPVAPQTSANTLPSPSPKPNPDAKPNSAQPKPSPSPNPQASPKPSPAPSPNAAPTPPNPNASPTTDEPEGSNQDNSGQAAAGFGIGFEWPNDICQMSSPVACTDPVDRPAQIQTEPTATQVTRLFQDLGLKVTPSTELETVIIVEPNGTATVAPDTTTVLQGHLTASQAEALAQNIIAFYRFSPTLREGQATPYGYTITLSVTPNM
ncbi:MAG: hypothetical protein AAGG51_04360 [Cyanobacteria bacterium P01_G01_bin.54]